MDAADRDAITRSIANLWTFNAIFIARLLGHLEEESGISEGTIDRLLQGIDADADAILDGPDDQIYAAGLLAAVRERLRQRREQPRQKP